jgi:hypothetical protein
MEKINVYNYKQYRDGAENDVFARVCHVNYVIDGLSERFDISDSYPSIPSNSFSVTKTGKTIRWQDGKELVGYKVGGWVSLAGSDSYAEYLFTMELDTYIFAQGSVGGSVNCTDGMGGTNTSGFAQGAYVYTTQLEWSDEMGMQTVFGFNPLNLKYPYTVDVYLKAAKVGSNFTCDVYYEYEFYLLNNQKFIFSN